MSGGQVTAMGGITRSHVLPLNYTEKASGSAECRCGINMEEEYGKVCAEGSGSGGKGGLRDRKTRAMRIIGRKYCGPSNSSRLRAHRSFSISITTRPLWW